PQPEYADGRGCFPAVAGEAGSPTKPKQFDNGFLYKQLSNRVCDTNLRHEYSVECKGHAADFASPHQIPPGCIRPDGVNRTGSDQSTGKILLRPLKASDHFPTLVK